MPERTRDCRQPSHQIGARGRRDSERLAVTERCQATSYDAAARNSRASIGEPINILPTDPPDVLLRRLLCRILPLGRLDDYHPGMVVCDHRMVDRSSGHGRHAGNTRGCL